MGITPNVNYPQYMVNQRLLVSTTHAIYVIYFAIRFMTHFEL